MMQLQNFTEHAYAGLLDKAISRFKLHPVDPAKIQDGIAFWRHDIDFSPHRALVMAQMEAERGVAASYFVMLSSPAYNVFEPEIRNILIKLVELGHEVGLHFDMSAHNLKDFAALEEALQFESSILGKLLNHKVCSFSIHNPTVDSGLRMEAPHYVGLLNASAPYLYEQMTYCSDSNGVWRFRPLDEVIEDLNVRRLYALTHPEWWQQNEMLPRARIQRCIDGRRVWLENYYDTLLITNNRPNIGRKVR